MHSRAMGGCVVNEDATRGHHLLKIPHTQVIGQIPPAAEQDP